MIRSSLLCCVACAALSVVARAQAPASEPADASPSAAAAPAAPSPPTQAPAPEAGAEGSAPLSSAANPGASDEKIVAILDLKVDGDVSGLANALAAMMASDVEGRAGLRSVSRNELRSLLSSNADAQLLGCDTMNCMSDIARLADARLLVSGSLGLVAAVDGIDARGPALVLALSLIDPAVPVVVGRAEASWRGKPEELVTAVPALLDRLFDGAAAASYVGAVEVFAPEGATVVLDGSPARPGKNTGVPIGVRTLEVSQAGYITRQLDVAVLRNATSVVRVELEAEPFYTRWWFWTGVGVGVAAAVAGGTVVYLEYASGQKQPLPPTVLKVSTPFPSALSR